VSSPDWKRAGADFEHLVAVHLDRAGHPAHRAGRSDGDPEADVEIVSDIGVLAILGQAELLARREEEGALVGRRPEIVEAEQHLIAVPAPLKIFGLLGRAIGRHPGDELGLAGERRPLGGQGLERRGSGERRRRAKEKFASEHERLPNHAKSVALGRVSKA